MKAAYRRRARETHPDAGGSAKEFEEIKEVYDRYKGGYSPDPRRTATSIFSDLGAALEAEMRNMTPQQRAEFLRRVAKTYTEESSREYEEFMSRTAKWDERTFQSKVISALESVGQLVFNCIGNVRQGRGWPDLWIGSPHWTGWLELKVDDHVLEPEQILKIKSMRERRVPALVLRYKNSNRTLRIETWEGNVLEWWDRDEWGPEKGTQRGKVLMEKLRQFR